MNWSQQAYLKPFNTGEDDRFGLSVGVSGDHIVVGAPNEDSATTGVNSVPVDGGKGADSGAVYLFSRSGVNWSQRAYLKASNTGATDSFGVSVAIDGNTIVVGANDEDSRTTGVNSTPDDDGSADASGAAYIFEFLRPPTLRVKGKKRVTTTRRRYTLNGFAVDADGDLVRVEAKDSRPRGRKKFRSARGTDRWKYKTPLKSGRNVVKVRSVDATGRKSKITRVIIKKK